MTRWAEKDALLALLRHAPGVALTANVLLGPLGIGVLEWRVSANGLNQTYGADGASLFLVVPVTLWGQEPDPMLPATL